MKKETQQQDIMNKNEKIQNSENGKTKPNLRYSEHTLEPLIVESTEGKHIRNYHPMALRKILLEKKKICYNEISIQPYIGPVILCYNCDRFGRSQKFCRAKARCLRCAEEHKTKVCKNEQIKCIHC